MAVAEVVELIRSSQWPPGYQPLLIPAAVVQGGRQKKHIRWLTGLSIAKLGYRNEELGMRNEKLKLQDDPHTVLCWADQSGGLFVVYKYELNDGYRLEQQVRYYGRVFQWGCDYFERLTGGQADRTLVGPTRAVPLCHDPTVYYNGEAMPFLSTDIIGKEKSSGGQEGKRPWATPEDIMHYLADAVSLRRNMVKARPEYREPGTAPDDWRLLDNTKLNTLYVNMNNQMRASKDDIYSVINSEYSPAFYPFHHYLESLPRWNGRDDAIRVLSLTVTVKGGEEKQELFYQYLKKWLVGMVAGWIDPQDVNTAMLVLIGRQGSNKTTWFNYLLPPQLQQYYCLKVNSGEMLKDDRLKLSQYGLICYEELDAMSDAVMNQLKSVMTMRYTDERIPFDRFPEQRKHIASYCATGNNVIFLNDKTGTRRFLPFEVESILSPRDFPFDYEGLYSQAYGLYCQGFKYYFSGAEEDALLQHNVTFETPRTEEELVDYYFSRPTGRQKGEFIPTAIAQQVVCSGSSLKVSTVALGRAFTRLGFESRMVGRMRGYIVVQRSDDERKRRAGMIAHETEQDSGESVTDDTDVF